MAQRGIREYDAKMMRHRFVDMQYQGYLYEGADDTDGTKLQQFIDDLRSSGTSSRVVKPDQLFGKRGKHGLLGIGLSVDEVIGWISEKNGTTVQIGETLGVLHTFLAEPLISHDEEYYVSFETARDHDIIRCSMQGGVEIEEVWESVREVKIGIGESTVIPKTGGTKARLESTRDFESKGSTEFSTMDSRLHGNDKKSTLTSSVINSQPGHSSLSYESRIQNLLTDISKHHQPLLQQFIAQLIEFAMSHGITYLEVNPLTIVDGKIYCLDMVAKVDTTESWKQGEHRNDLQLVKPFGNVSHPLEDAIDELDAKSGASVQFRIMNPQGRIGLLLGGGGASVVVMDKLAQLGLIDEVINYGDLSGNPSYGDNKAYIEGVIKLMLSNDHDKQYLCYMGGIANFTMIDVVARAYIDALTPYVDQIKLKNIYCVIRRGGPGDTHGLAKIGSFLEQHEIPHVIADGDDYLTKVLESIELN